MMGKCYNSGVKLSKAEKAQKESEAKVKKLTQTGTKEDQDADKAHAEMDTSDMLELLSDEDEPPMKFTFKKPPLWKCHDIVGDKEGTEKKLTTKKPSPQKPPCK